MGNERHRQVLPRDPFILLFPSPFLYLSAAYTACTLSISAVDPRRARCRFEP